MMIKRYLSTSRAPRKRAQKRVGGKAPQVARHAETAKQGPRSGGERSNAARQPVLGRRGGRWHRCALAWGKAAVAVWRAVAFTYSALPRVARAAISLLVRLLTDRWS